MIFQIPQQAFKQSHRLYMQQVFDTFLPHKIITSCTVIIIVPKNPDIYGCLSIKIYRQISKISKDITVSICSKGIYYFPRYFYIAFECRKLFFSRRVNLIAAILLVVSSFPTIFSMLVATFNRRESVTSSNDPITSKKFNDATLIYSISEPHAPVSSRCRSPSSCKPLEKNVSDTQEWAH